MRYVTGDLFDYCGEKNVIVVPSTGKYHYRSQRKVSHPGRILWAV